MHGGEGSTSQNTVTWVSLCSVASQTQTVMTLVILRPWCQSLLSMKLWIYFPRELLVLPSHHGNCNLPSLVDSSSSFWAREKQFVVGLAFSEKTPCSSSRSIIIWRKENTKHNSIGLAMGQPVNQQNIVHAQQEAELRSNMLLVGSKVI